MNREEALVDFKKNVAGRLISDYKKEFENNINKNENKIFDLLVDSIVKLNDKVGKIREIKKDYLVKYIEFELLRTNILDDSFIIFVHGYDEKWYLDENCTYQEINLQFLFEPFIRLKDVLKKEKKRYVGKINDYDIQNIIFNIVRDCYYGMENMIKENFFDFDENNIEKDLFLAEHYYIKWTEYMDQNSKIVFSMDYKKKGTENLKAYIKQPYVYPLFINSSLDKYKMQKQDMYYANFKGSSLSEINIGSCKMPRCIFAKTHLKDCYFDNDVITGGVFKNAKLENVVFDNCDLCACNFNFTDCYGLTFNNCNLDNASFYKVSLSNISFDKCSMNQINFVDSNFKEMNFNGSNLKEALFCKDVIPYINISSQQLQDIYIWEGVK